MASPSMGSQNTAALQQQMAVCSARVRVSANWFLIIGALSVINSLISMGGGGMRFIFGLGVTAYVDAFGHAGGAASVPVTLALSVLFSAFIALFGYFGRKEQKWAFLVGMGLYLCDGLILLPAHLYLDAAFHAWALFRLYQGLQAMNLLEKLRGKAISAGAVSASWQQ